MSPTRSLAVPFRQVGGLGVELLVVVPAELFEPPLGVVAGVFSEPLEVLPPAAPPPPAPRPELELLPDAVVEALEPAPDAEDVPPSPLVVQAASARAAMAGMMRERMLISLRRNPVPAESNQVRLSGVPSCSNEKALLVAEKGLFEAPAAGIRDPAASAAGLPELP